MGSGLLADVYAASPPKAKPSWPKVLTAPTASLKASAGLMGTALAKRIEEEPGILTTVTVGHPLERARACRNKQTDLRY